MSCILPGVPIRRPHVLVSARAVPSGSLLPHSIGAWHTASERMVESSSASTAFTSRRAGALRVCVCVCVCVCSLHALVRTREQSTRLRCLARAGSVPVSLTPSYVSSSNRLNSLLLFPSGSISFARPCLNPGCTVDSRHRSRYRTDQHQNFVANAPPGASTALGS